MLRSLRKGKPPSTWKKQENFSMTSLSVMEGRTGPVVWHCWSWRRGQRNALYQKVFIQLYRPLRPCSQCYEDPKVLEDYLKLYFDKFGDKACCFEDLKPYIALDGEGLAEWTSYLRQTPIAMVIQPLAPADHNFDPSERSKPRRISSEQSTCSSCCVILFLKFKSAKNQKLFGQINASNSTSRVSNLEKTYLRQSSSPPTISSFFTLTH